MAEYKRIWENCIPPEIIIRVTSAHPDEIVYKNLVKQALFIAKLEGKEIEIPEKWK